MFRYPMAMDANKIRIMVIDDQAVVRQGFVSLIKTVPDMEIIGEGSNGQEAVDLFRRLRPDITLMDLRMPGVSGAEAIKQIRGEFPAARIIVLTTFDGDEDIYRAVQAGAQGYLLKDMFFEELEAAIRKVHAGARLIPGSVAERLAARMSSSELTGRELEVLRQIVDGKSNKEIGNALNISEATVKSHINNILSKLGVSDRTQAATTALQRGIVHFR
jgi:two-component system NarL family response regulator